MPEEAPLHLPDDETLQLAYEANEAHSQYQRAEHLRKNLEEQVAEGLPHSDDVNEALDKYRAQHLEGWQRFHDINRRTPTMYGADSPYRRPQHDWKPPASLRLGGVGIRSMTAEGYGDLVASMNSIGISVERVADSDPDFVEMYGDAVPVAALKDFINYAEQGEAWNTSNLGTRAALCLFREANLKVVPSIADYISAQAGMPRRGLIRIQEQNRGKAAGADVLDMVALREQLCLDQASFLDIRNFGEGTLRLTIAFVNDSFPHLDPIEPPIKR